MPQGIRKLTDTQLVILSAAAQRDDGAALPLPKSLRINGAAVTRTLDGLVKKGLLEEKPAPRDAVAWREGEAGQHMMLVVTPAGSDAIGVETEPPGPSPAGTRETAAPAVDPGAGPQPDARGQADVAAETEGGANTRAPRAGNHPRRVKSHRRRRAPAPGQSRRKGPKPGRSSRRDTKQDLIVRLLQRKNGATIDEIVGATGWQPHSVRGVISGTLKRKLGLTVTSDPVEKRGRVYRVAAPGPRGEGDAQDG